MIKKALVVFVAVIAGSLFFAAPAQASTNSAWAYTSDSGDVGGRARFLHDGDKVEACDLDRDSTYAWGFIAWNAGIGDVRADENGDCDTDKHTIVEQTLVVVWACLGNAAGTSFWSCTPFGDEAVGVS